jgi:hypothetical protein
MGFLRIHVDTLFVKKIVIGLDVVHMCRVLPCGYYDDVVVVFAFGFWT